MGLLELGLTGTANPADWSGLYNEQLYIVRQLLGRVNVAMLVQVKAVNGGGIAAAGSVDVQPMVNQLDGLNRTVPRGKMFNLPYFRLQGGSGAVILDPQVGDIGVALFADRDISTVKRTKAQGNPGSRRRFDAADGLYFGGFLSASAPTSYLQILSSGNITLANATAQLTLLADGSINPKSWVGLIAPFAASSIPPGWLACPSTVTLASTTTYAGLFAVIGYAWGGSGASFGLPYFATGHTLVAGTVAALTHGTVKNHVHVVSSGTVAGGGGTLTAGAVLGLGNPTSANPTSPEGGADNLAAGMGVQWCVKY